MPYQQSKFLTLNFLKCFGLCGRYFPLDGCRSGQFDILLIPQEVYYTFDTPDVYSSLKQSLGVNEDDKESRVRINILRSIDALLWECGLILTTYNNESSNVCHLFKNIDGYKTPPVYIMKEVLYRIFKHLEDEGIGRKNSTRVAIILLTPFFIPFLSLEEISNVTGSLQETRLEIKTFFVYATETSTLNAIYLEKIIFVGLNNFDAGHIFSMALCGQCKSGWFEYRSNNETMSCYKIHVASKNEDWLEASERCGREGGYLAAVESKDELEFLQERLYLYILENRQLIYDSVGPDPNSVILYIGLRWNSESKDKGFQWMTKNSFQSRPLILNHWLPGRPTGSFSYACGAWQFKDLFNESQVINVQPNHSAGPMFSVYKSNKNGWADIGCGTKFTKISLCEVSLSHSFNNQNLKVHEQSIKKGSIIFSQKRESFKTIREEIVSVSADIDSSVKFPAFSCQNDVNPRYISYSYVCDCKSQCSNSYDEYHCGKSKDRTCSDTEYYNKHTRTRNIFGTRTFIRRNLRTQDDCKVCGNNLCCDRTYLPFSFFMDDATNCSGCNLIGHNNLDLKTETCPSECSRFQCLYESQFRILNSTCHKDHLNDAENKLEKVMLCSNQLENSVWAPRCVFLKDTYGSIIGCRDLSHLQNCTYFQCQEGYYKCPGSYCIPEQYITDGESDCPRREEEIDVPVVKCTGLFVCQKNDVCLHPYLVCDGHPDCPYEDDELDCNTSCAEGFLCIAGTVTVNGYNKSVPLESLHFIDSEIRFLNLSGISLSLKALSTLHHLQELRYLLISNCKITNSHDGFINSNLSFTVHQIDMSYNQITSISEYSFNLKAFAYLRELNLSFNSNLVQFTRINLSLLVILDLSHTGLSYLEKRCFERLRELKHLNLSYIKLSSFHWEMFSSSQKLETLDLRGVPIVEFSANNVKDFKIISFLYTDKFGLCCPQIKGSEIPAYVCHAPEDAISSCFDLIGVEVQRILLWVVAVIALVGNLIVIVYRLLWDRAFLKKAYGLFVTSLAASDLIMGLYLLIIAGADVYYRGIYVLYDKEWKESVVCKVAGFLATLSSETSTFFIFLITVDRFLVISFPYGQIQFTNRSKTIVLAVTWLASFTLALVMVLLIYGSDSVFTSSAMCLALPLSYKMFPGWEYSLSVFIVLNFVMFLFIVIGQIAIFRAMSANRMSKEATNQNLSQRAQDITVAKQLSLVVLSNFCCWFPMGFMGLLSLGGHVISNDSYAWIIVLVLPINSAVNPLLYYSISKGQVV